MKEVCLLSVLVGLGEQEVGVSLDAGIRRKCVGFVGMSSTEHTPLI